VAWRVEFLPEAERERLDEPVRDRMLELLRDRLGSRKDPRGLGEPLRGPELGKYWKYRVGDYRIVCSIRGDRILIVVVRTGHRREVYR
jgi:mRNA interferase RelE/StbE